MTSSPEVAAERRLVGRWYQALDFHMARAPLLPVSRYPSRTGRDNTSDLMQEDPNVRLAVAVSSLPLARALEHGDSTEKPPLQGGLLRYAIRMTTRPTPFGLSAGVALGRWGELTDLRIADAPPQIAARLDMVGLVHLVTELESRLEVRKSLRLAANPAVHEHAGRMSLSGVESSRTVTGGENVSLRATNAVRHAIELARSPIGYQDLAQALIDAVAGATEARVDGLLETLWRHGFLITDLRPPLTGDPARHVAARLSTVPAAADVGARLERLLARLTAWGCLPIAERAAEYRAVAAEVNAVTGLESKTPLQVDMVFPLAGQRVSGRVAAEAVRAAELLIELTPFPDGVPSMTAYRQAFEARYGIDRDVPLLELLDSSAGLGPPPDAARRTPSGREVQRDRTLLALATAALHDREPLVRLDRDTIEMLRLSTPTPDRLPVSLDLYVLVAAASADAIDAGDFELIVGPNVGATAAGRNLGRFADQLGSAATAALDHVTAAEEALLPERVFAEVTFLPEVLRTANVVVRPLIRDYEIGIPASATPSRVPFIPLDQLYVRVSGGRFALIWVADKPREVVPCAGHMLNHVRAPAVCRFLADLSRDGLAQLVGFDWGPARGFPFLPRVQSGRVVLHLAQWRLDATVGAAGLANGSQAEFTAAFARWRRRWRVPRHVFLRTDADAADHRLLLDLSESAHVAEVRRALRRTRQSGGLILQEAWPGLAEAWLEGPDGRRSAELVVSFVRRQATSATDLRPVTDPVPRLTRLRPPGSDWTYVKLYCQPDDEDALISGPLREFAEQLTTTGRADRWFFVRYSDPDPHVRLRLGGEGEQLVPAVCTWATELVADERLSHFALDTYEREIERYGGPVPMAISEDVFAADSIAAAELIDLELSGSCSLDRQTIAMVGVDTLLAGLGLSERERLDFYGRVAGHLRHAGHSYRERKTELWALFRQPSLPSELSDIVARRRALLTECAARLSESDLENRLRRTKTELYQSYVHLHCNRVLGRDRALERTVLELLHRTRRSLVLGA